MLSSHLSWSSSLLLLLLHSHKRPLRRVCQHTVATSIFSSPLSAPRRLFAADKRVLPDVWELCEYESFVYICIITCHHLHRRDLRGQFLVEQNRVFIARLLVALDQNLKNIAPKRPHHFRTESFRWLQRIMGKKC